MCMCVLHVWSTDVVLHLACGLPLYSCKGYASPVRVSLFCAMHSGGVVVKTADLYMENDNLWCACVSSVPPSGSPRARAVSRDRVWAPMYASHVRPATTPSTSRAVCYYVPVSPAPPLCTRVSRFRAMGSGGVVKIAGLHVRYDEWCARVCSAPSGSPRARTAADRACASTCAPHASGPSLVLPLVCGGLYTLVANAPLGAARTVSLCRPPALWRCSGAG